MSPSGEHFSNEPGTAPDGMEYIENPYYKAKDTEEETTEEKAGC